MRSRIPVRNPGIRTHQMPAIVFNIPAIQRFNHHHPFTVFHGSSHRAFQAFQIDMVDNHLIDHYLDAVHLITIQLHPMEDLFQLAIDTDVQISFFTYLLEKFLIVPLTITDQRSQEIRFLPVVFIQDQP